MLPAAFVLSWLPALAAAYALRPWGHPALVLTAAGPAGAAASAGLGATLVLLTAGYAAALRRPPPLPALAVAAFGSLAAALLMPVLFSADSYAYAYYGDLAVRGMNPYGHGPAPPGALAAAAVGAWDGHVPPRCVYGPLAVAVAVAADVLGAPAGAAGQLFAQRLAAAAAFAIAAVFVVRLFPDQRARAAILLNPVVLWSVAEGHNDAVLAACVLAGLALPHVRTILLTAGALVKAPALLAWRTLHGPRAIAAAAALTAVGYLPLALAAAAAAPETAAGGTAPWYSPVGLLAVIVGRLPALGLAAAALVAAAVALRRLPPPERTAAYALAGWFALPNAYPWYALWTVPLAARNLASPWSRALVAAALVAPARAVSDAVAGADTPGGISTFHLGMIAIEYLPPLLVIGVTGSRLGRRTAAAAALAAGFILCTAANAGAQTAAPSPQPAPAPSTPTAAAAPPASALPAAGDASSAPAPPAAPSSQPVPVAAPQPVPSGMPAATPQGAVPGPSSAAPGPTGTASGPTGAAPSPAPTSNPFGYIINPAPTPATNPDGPHILQVAINDRRIHAGGPLLVRVVTSANVVGVEARALGRFIAIPQNAPGIFALAYTMPGGIPFWLLNRNYDIVIAAATADGRQTSVSFPMLLLR